jgi:hypothetical protein
MSPAWGCMLVIPALGRLRQEDLEFKASLGYIQSGRPCLKKKKKYIYICIYMGVWLKRL